MPKIKDIDSDLLPLLLYLHFLPRLVCFLVTTVHLYAIFLLFWVFIATESYENTVSHKEKHILSALSPEVLRRFYLSPIIY